jgi:hypothetical protein
VVARLAITDGKGMEEDPASPVVEARREDASGRR